MKQKATESCLIAVACLIILFAGSASGPQGYPSTAWAGTRPSSDQVTMTVSFNVSGGGSGSSAPQFSYIQNGQGVQATLTGSPIGITCDSGTVWAVAPNPLEGSTDLERWYSNQALNGTAMGGTYDFSFQHQYMLTMLVSPSSSGTVTPQTGWQNAGSQVDVSVSTGSEYVFQSWSGSGSGNYTGLDNPASVTMNSAVMETANFGGGGLITMTVSYTVVGGGLGYSAPALNYLQAGIARQQNLTETPASLQLDSGSAWSVVLNPLSGAIASELAGSTDLERWYSPQRLNGTATGGTYVFSFQHQYMLTMLVSPSGGGSVMPISGWQNAGSSLGISASADSRHVFQSWSGSGSGNYTGRDNPASVTMNSAVMETAAFQSSGGTVTMTVSYAVVGGGLGYSAPMLTYVNGGLVSYYVLAETPIGMLLDAGSAWFVAPNPLTGSSDTERWYSSQTLNGTASTQPIVFSFQHQYALTMESSPSDAGTILPASGWQNAGASISIAASPIPSYVFQTWLGSGSASYSGSSNPVSITMNSPVTEIASFAASGSSPTPITMTVSFQATGGGVGYSAPAFSCVLNGASRQATLNQTASGVQCDSGTAWTVTPNPLTGSTVSEHWYTSQSLSGTASEQTILFSFQHQYYLTMRVSPPGSGTLMPSQGWQDAGASVTIRATPASGYTFRSWSGTGSGGYTGENNPASITMSGAIMEVAALASTGSALPSSACQFIGTASIVGGTPPISSSPTNFPGGMQQLLLPLSQALPASGLVSNRQSRRGLKRLMPRGRRGGLSNLASIIILIILIVAAVAGIAAYYYSIGGAANQPQVIFAGSIIKVNVSANTGTVYVKMYNEGSSAIRVGSVNVTAKAGNFGVDFSSGLHGIVSAPHTNCTISGGQGLGMGGSGGNGYLTLPAGTTVAIIVTFSAGMRDYFEPGTRYPAMVIPVKAAQIPFSIPSEGG